MTADAEARREDGIPISGDFTRLKPPANQIALTQFMSFTEQYLRNLTPQDLLYLDIEVMQLN